MPLSVLSALARLNIDPWLEAAELARLPRETATQRLASSIAALPDGPLAHLEHGTVAARLIALLPRQASSELPSRATLPDAGDVAKFRAGMYMFAILIVIMMAASAGFATPIGYQTNLMVYGPGGYRFSDYVKIGVPLDILVGVVTVALAPLVWPFAS